MIGTRLVNEANVFSFIWDKIDAVFSIQYVHYISICKLYSFSLTRLKINWCSSQEGRGFQDLIFAK